MASVLAFYLCMKLIDDGPVESNDGCTTCVNSKNMIY